MRKCIKITVWGKVQGVGYREFIKKIAEEHSIEGTVQNIDDGSVLVYACGASDNLDGMIDGLYKGTSSSEIKDVSIEPLVNDKDFRGVFRIIGL